MLTNANGTPMDQLDVLEAMMDQVMALNALSGLLCGCREPDAVQPSALVDEGMVLEQSSRS